MKLIQILETVTKTLAGIMPGGKERPEELGKLDRGILEVALLVAALDGTILPEEYAAFLELAKQCRGATDANVRDLMDAALGSAGRLMAMAQVGVYSEQERLGVFVKLAGSALTNGFAYGSESDIRRGFALWVAMGVADGEFSSLERQAVEALRDHLSIIQNAHDQAMLRLNLSDGLGPQTITDELCPTPSASFLPSGFLEQVESVVRDLAVEEKRVDAEAKLSQLISIGL